MYFQKFSVQLGVKLYKNSIYMLLGDPSVVPTRPWLILGSGGAVVASVAISALGGPRQTVTVLHSWATEVCDHEGSVKNGSRQSPGDLYVRIEMQSAGAHSVYFYIRKANWWKANFGLVTIPCQNRCPMFGLRLV